MDTLRLDAFEDAHATSELSTEHLLPFDLAKRNQSAQAEQQVFAYVLAS